MSSSEILAYWRSLPTNIRGMCWLALSGISLTAMTVVIKLAGSRLDVFQILLVRQLVVVSILLPYVVRHPRNAFSTPDFRMQAIRIALSVTAMVSGYTAVINLSFSSAVTLTFTKGIFVFFFAMLILKETITYTRWSVILVGFIGILIIVQPSVDKTSLYALAGLVSAAALGLLSVVLRKISQSERFLTILTYQAFGVGAVLLIPGVVAWQTPTGTEWALLIGSGLLSVVGQALYFLAFRAGEASGVAFIEYLQLPYAAIWGLIIFDEVPHMSTVVGAGLILGITAYGVYAERQAGSSVKKGG